MDNMTAGSISAICAALDAQTPLVWQRDMSKIGGGVSGHRKGGTELVRLHRDGGRAVLILHPFRWSDRKIIGSWRTFTGRGWVDRMVEAVVPEVVAFVDAQSGAP